MMSRIMTMQRQARELGRLRTGYTEATGRGRARPVRSETWIVSSHAEHYVEAAAATWGGTVEKWEPQGGGAAQWRVITEATSIDAILPSGDPLSQSYELWSGGGASRRCDGITETLSNSPCLCLAQFGETFYEQEKGKVCDPTSRLNVFLPDMPDVGVWRAETHSYYAAGEIAGAVDLIRSATGTSDVVLPISLRIEQRQRKAKGQTKKFPVIVVELRGITTGQVLTNRVDGVALESTAQRQQLTAGGASGGGSRPVTQDVDSTLTAIAAAGSRDDLTVLWRSIPSEAMTDELRAEFSARGKELSQNDSSSTAKATATGEAGESTEQLWQKVVASAAEGWTSQQLEDDFLATTGVDAGKANADHMRAYLDVVNQGAEQPS